MSTPVLLKAVTREVRPWKNRGGRTSEVVSFPFGSGADDFGWRISVADVGRDGPFSIFPLVERHIVILAGTLCLRFDDYDRVITAGDAPRLDPLSLMRSRQGQARHLRRGEVELPCRTGRQAGLAVVTVSRV